jgi:uncharacterized protein (DUF4415 family)
MKDAYDLGTMKSRPNPYAERLKKQITLSVSGDVVDYFEGMAQESGVPYQILINLYLRDCVANHRKLKIRWAS